MSSEKTHSVRSNAVRAARKLLGREAKQGVDFTISGDKTTGYRYSVVEKAVSEPAPASLSAAATPTEPPKPRSVKVKRIRAKVKAKAEARIGRKPLEKAQDVSGKRHLMFSLICRPEGASLDTLTNKLGWQKHTVRGAISTIASQFKVKIKSYRNERGQRIYRAMNKGKRIAA